MRSTRITIGVIVHGDSTVSGHGPGVTALLTGPASRLKPLLDHSANLAEILGVRTAQAPRQHATLPESDRPRQRIGTAAPVDTGLF